MNLSITEILIISTPNDTPSIKKFLGDGSSYNVKLSYAIQERPRGIADAFLVGEKFIGKDAVCLILGDNIFYGSEISGDILREKIDLVESDKNGAFIFAYHVSDPERYGVVEFNNNEEDNVLGLEEKPKDPKSNWAITGLYFYNNDVINIAKSIKPSARGELEITDINKAYLAQNRLGVIKLKRGFAWLDAGTPDSLLDSAKFIQTIEARQGLKIACLEEIAYRKHLISVDDFKKLVSTYKVGSPYRNYLETIIKHDRI